MSHRRNIAAMQASPRCGARTRNGTPCRAPASHGKRRCRMHGGSPRSGAPRGNRNARKSATFTRERIAERSGIGELMIGAEKLLKKLV